MTNLVSSEDLQLVSAVARTGSVGAAARQLRVSQPSASERLARLERRCGVPLFDRDTQGARATAAGAELARQADHILGHLAGALDAAREAGHDDVCRVGVVPSLAERVLPAIDAALPGTRVDQRVEHGDRMLEWLDEGTLDAAVLGIGDQVEIPRSLRRHRIGTDELALFLPVGVRAPREGRLPAGTVVVATYDGSLDALRSRVIGHGAEPLRAATVPCAVALARRRRCAAVVPRSVVEPRGRERLLPVPWRHRLRLDLVTPRRADPALVRTATALRDELGLVR